MIVEQINRTTGAVLCLHHDQAGSTRLITGSTGKTEATFTYGAYGELTGSTGTATTPLGYDGQYTSSDTGLVYGQQPRGTGLIVVQILHSSGSTGTVTGKCTYSAYGTPTCEGPARPRSATTGNTPTATPA
jgi:hypothetical protein